jgi:hypothetical protein
MKIDNQQLRWYQRQAEKPVIGKQWKNARPYAIETKTHESHGRIPLKIHEPEEIIVADKVGRLMKRMGYE